MAGAGLGQPEAAVGVVGADAVADGLPGLVVPQQHDAVLEQIRPLHGAAGPRLDQRVARGELDAEIDAVGIRVAGGGDLLELAREHFRNRPAGFEQVHLAHALAEGALHLREHGVQAQDDERQQGDGDEDFDEREAARSVVRGPCSVVSSQGGFHGVLT